ncbi:MAG: DUF3455 domain-containing protein [Burkholderiales bacterium]|jgi:hypothetical protein|nr:DUF3455 domain-containing protein [Burkholderiales bacterium]
MSTDRRHPTAAASAVAALLVAACATPSPPPPPAPSPPQAAPTVPAPRLGWFTKIKVPAEYAPVLRLRGRGYQVFRCEDSTEGLAWVYQLPEATLADDRANPVGRHGANFTFEHDDGSRLAGKVQAWDDAPDPGDLRWLLLSTQSYGRGAFEGVAYVQRVNTLGGMPPARCTASDRGQVLRVEFSADFIFYRAAAGAK